jgi:hypothetical protein
VESFQARESIDGGNLIGGRSYTTVLLGGILIAYAMHGGRTEHKILICKETQTESSLH